MKHKLLISIVLVLTFVSTAMAQTSEGQESNTPSIVPEVQIPEGTTGPSKLVLVQQLPSGSWQAILGGAVRIILGITGSLALIAFTVGGVMLVTAQGSEDRVDKAKKILLWSVLALAVIAGSYAIVLGVTQLEFFQ